jgi:FtsP/CotA-like multicopper oxidase with cupredoxin domain
MSEPFKPVLSRRAFVATSLAGAAAAAAPIPGIAGPSLHSFRLRAAPGRTRLVPEPHPDTVAWCYNGTVPGPEIRVRQGERLRVEVTNALDEETTVHWHGIRVPNAMDGVPHLTQPPIAPGGTFVYEFDAVDAGTFWYHPHQRSFEQVGRGLYGALIVEEPDPPRVDRDVTWVLDDWRLTQDAGIAGDFGNFHDLSHAGRLGNTVTINGRLLDSFEVAPGERIRLRLINAANARVFALDFADLAPQVIALDGQPVAPHSPQGGRVVLGPAMRADLILDCTGRPGARLPVVDRAYEGNEFHLVDLVYGETPLRGAPPDWPVTLTANPLPEPDLTKARRHDVLFTGGMMGPMVERQMGLGGTGAMMGGGMMGMMHDRTGIWFVNGVAAEGHVLDPFLTLDKYASHVIEMTNATAFDHPIHLHGHSFRVISRNGAPTRHREWQDTVMIAPTERVEIAFVADNPGEWMFHCHILEHQAAGMMGVIRVA